MSALWSSLVTLSEQPYYGWLLPVSAAILGLVIVLVIAAVILDKLEDALNAEASTEDTITEPFDDDVVRTALLQADFRHKAAKGLSDATRSRHHGGRA